MTRWPGAPFGLLSVVVCLLVALSAPAFSEEAQDTSSRPTPADPTGLATYRIGAGDTLQVFVWKEPDLTREVAVRIDGKISVALLGDVDAAGRTPGELADELARQLKRFVGTPMVTVGVSQPNSTRFFVLGMVVRSGEFRPSGPTTVVQALALAGGFREYAKTDEILVLRQQGGTSRFIPVNYQRLVSGRDGAQNVLLQPGDTVLVP
jgi:polysaccharide biosynthesis/export protein